MIKQSAANQSSDHYKPPEKLVFLHIEKSAGSSQREIFQSVIGQEYVFWWGLDSGSLKFNSTEIEQMAVVGGHRRIAFYNKSNYLYLALVRNPVERVISLFNYLRIHEAANWREKGLDTQSFDNTFNDSEAFKRHITSAQCVYVSGFTQAEAANMHIRSGKYLVGSFENLEKFNQVLAVRLGWADYELKHSNQGNAGYSNTIQIGEDVHERLLSCLEEDIKLYEFIKQQQQGLVDSTSARDWLEIRKNIDGICSAS